MYAESIAIVDLEQLKDTLGITDGESDLVLDRVIKGVSQAVEDFLGRPVVARKVTAALDGDGTDTLLLKPPLLSVTTLSIDSVSVTSTDWAVYSDIGKLRLKYTVFGVGIQNVAIVYRHGWEKDDIPESIKLAALEWCVHSWLLTEKDRIGVASKTSGDETTTYVSGMPRDVRETLYPYKLAGGFGQ